MVLAVLAVAAAGGLAFSLLRPAGDAAPAEAAPPIELADLRAAGERVRLADYRGKPVVVNFFASWCAPCKRELPLLRAAAARTEGRVAFLGIAHLDDRDLALAMLDEYGVDFDAGFDPDGDVARRYRLRGLPSTVFIDADGALLGVLAGELRADDLDRWMDRLAGDGE